MTTKRGNLLIIDDNESILLTLKQALKYEFNSVETLQNPNLIPTYLDKQDWDIVILDMNFKAGINSGNEGLYWLRKIKEHRPEEFNYKRC